MTQIEVFQFPATGQQLRTVLVDGAPWFVAADVASVLDLGNLHSSLALLDDDERSLHTVESGQRSMSIVSEAGLYSLILRSRKTEARAFKRWITHEVLPQIRATGRYEVTRLGDELEELEAANLRTAKAIQIARAERAARQEAERALAIAEPQAEAWQVLASSEGDYAVREAAFILNRDPAIDTGQGRLFRVLREWKLIDSHNRPYAAHARHVRLRATHYQNPRTGEEEATTQVRITLAGLQYLHRRMGGTSQLRLLLPSEAA